MRLSNRLLAGLFVLTLYLATQSRGQDKQWLTYEPAVVELEGKLVVESKYGPPGFGEDPKTDAKVKVAILLLPRAVNVRGKPHDELNQESVEGVKRIQLVLPIGQRYSNLIGKRVLARGSLFHTHTGHHYTVILMTVREISEIRSR